MPISIKRLKVGAKAPKNSTIYLCRGFLDSRTIIETFEANDNPDWVCEETVNGFWYGYSLDPDLQGR